MMRSGFFLGLAPKTLARVRNSPYVPDVRFPLEEVANGRSKEG
jgi:hypothetical protein